MEDSWGISRIAKDSRVWKIERKYLAFSPTVLFPRPSVPWRISRPCPCQSRRSRSDRHPLFSQTWFCLETEMFPGMFVLYTLHTCKCSFFLLGYRHDPPMLKKPFFFLPFLWKKANWFSFLLILETSNDFFLVSFFFQTRASCSAGATLSTGSSFP